MKKNIIGILLLVTLIFAFLTSCVPASVVSSNGENSATKMYFDDEFSDEELVYANKSINVIKFRDGGVICYVVLSNLYREAYPGIFCLQ